MSIAPAKGRLPRWVTSNETSLQREAADYIPLSPSERAAIVAQLCQDAQTLLDARSDGERARAYRDPLPESSRALLARLRTAHRTARRVGG